MINDVNSVFLLLLNVENERKEGEKRQEIDGRRESGKKEKEKQ